jgi:hypothetical protein
LNIISLMLLEKRSSSKAIRSHSSRCGTDLISFRIGNSIIKSLLLPLVIASSFWWGGAQSFFPSGSRLVSEQGQSTLYTGGTYRLGGDDETSAAVSSIKTTVRELAARAA